MLDLQPPDGFETTSFGAVHLVSKLATCFIPRMSSRDEDKFDTSMFRSSQQNDVVGTFVASSESPTDVAFWGRCSRLSQLVSSSRPYLNHCTPLRGWLCETRHRLAFEFVSKEYDISCNRLAEQSFGVFNIGIHCILFEICLAKKKEDEQNRNFQVWFSRLSIR